MPNEGIGRILRKLRGRTPREALVRVRQAGALFAERNGPMGRGVSLDIEASRLGGTTSLAGILADPKRLTALAAWDAPRSVASTSFARWPAVANDVVGRADAALAGQFSLLGHSAVEFGQPIDWQLDPLARRRAPMTHWSRIAYLDPGVVGDHKVIWELNRHQHLVSLAQAHLLTGEDRYAAGAAAQLQHWLELNPPKLGINWASSLEISYRSIAWCWTLHLLRDHPALTSSLVSSALACLSLNARHIESYLSTYFAPNTHLTGEALGLLYVGCAFPELQGATRWRRTGWDILVDELDRQVLADGVYYEQSTYYQRYVLDIYVHAILLAERCGIPVPAVMCKRVQQLADVLEAVMDTEGNVPLIGDDDGGRLLALSVGSGTDVRPAIAAAARISGLPDAADSAEAAFETLWLTGVPVAVRRPGYEVDSRVFPDGGVVVLRHGTGRDTNLMVLDAGPLGATRTNAVHSHADALAFDLVALGRRLLVDPGTYTYVMDPELRDRFRSTRMHNTVSIGEGSSSEASGPFGWAVARHAQVDAWVHGGDFDFVSMSLQGYGRLGAKVVHRRDVLFLHALGWILRDRVTGHPEGLPVRLHFHGAPGIEIQAGYPGAVAFAGDDVSLQLLSTPCEAMTITDDLVSPLYGALVDSRSLTVMAASAGDVDVVTALVPHRGSSDVPRIAVSTAHRNSIEVQRAGESWQVGFGDPVRAAEQRADDGVHWMLERGGSLARIGSVAGTAPAHPDAPALAPAINSWSEASRTDLAWAIASGPIRHRTS